MRCFACEERRVASELERATTNKKAVWLEKEKELRWAKGDGLPEQTEVDCAHEVWERRRSSLLTCERGLRSALASGDECLMLRWSRSLREAEERLARAEADLARSEKGAWSEHAS